MLGFRLRARERELCSNQARYIERDVHGRSQDFVSREGGEGFEAAAAGGLGVGSLPPGVQ